MEVARRDGVRTVGFVHDEQKWEALASCEALIMPSAHESLSIALLEAWSVGKPVLVSARSKVLVGQCKRSQGGLWYSDTEEFCAALEYLLQDATLRRRLGAQGRHFVAANYDWPRIVEAYRGLISSVAG